MTARAVACIRWHIMMTEPQRESAAAAGLIGRRFNVYVPYQLIEKRQGPDRKRVEVLEPLIPGYLFVRLDSSAGLWNRARDVPGIRGYLELEGRKATLSDQAMQLLQSVEAEECASQDRQWPFKAGDTVQVGSGGGIHKGLCGKLEKIDKSDRATLSVVLPSRVWTILTSAAWLEPAA